ncbi:hypothetical protein AeMF1_014913 [Aphanomyces euteiches]|nr:hypothetical protein AeMF1_014913 [Aphanomyces euteiches]
MNSTLVGWCLAIAATLPVPEKHALKALIHQRDPRLIEIVPTADNIDKVVSLSTVAAVSQAFQSWYGIYHTIECSTDQARSLQLQFDSTSSWSASLLYGEVDFFGYASLLAKLNPQPGQIIYDLGHGTGRAVLAAALLYPQLHVVGIELVDSLYDVSCAALAEFHRRTLPSQGKVTLHHGDLTQIDWWTKSSIVFVNATAFSTSLWSQVQTLASRMQPGTVFVSLTQTLPVGGDFKLLDEEATSWPVATSWGSEPAYMYTKI